MSTVLQMMLNTAFVQFYEFFCRVEVEQFFSRRFPALISTPAANAGTVAEDTSLLTPDDG